MTQNNLGTALRALGERGDDAALPQAVAAFRAALEERTRDRTPLQWALTQNSLGNALRALGERCDDAALPQAAAAFRAALDVFRGFQVPRFISMAERNLSRVEALLATRKDPN
jgi:Tetratricopeptide repeat